MDANPMRLALLILSMACSSMAAQVAILQVDLQFTNRTEAIAYRTQMVAVSDVVKLTFTNSTETAWSQATNTIKGTNYALSARRAFASTNDVNTMLNFFKTNAFPATMSGRVSIHRCPADGTTIPGWLGCRLDPRAQYQEKVWP